MAKKKRGAKSAAVRDILTLNPDTPVKDIVSSLGAKGLSVKPNLVYFLRANMRASKRKKARQQAAKTMGTSYGNPIEIIRKVKGLAAEVGGLKRLGELVHMLAD